MSERPNSLPRNYVMRPGYYTDPSNGDLWYLSRRGGWSWVNGAGYRYRYIPLGLIWVDEPNPFA